MSSLREYTRPVGKKIGPAGGAFMLHPSTGERGQQIGLDFFQYYALGRCGVLGDVPGSAVAAALHFFEPGLVAGIWEVAKEKVNPREASAHYTETASAFARQRIGDVADLDTFAKLGERVVEAVDIPGLPLFAAWRETPMPDDAPARAHHVIHLLRELRGGANGIAIRAVGLKANEACAVNSPGMYQIFGWQGEMPDAEPLRERTDRAEDITDDIVGPAFEALDEGERKTFASVLDEIAVAIAR